VEAKRTATVSPIERADSLLLQTRAKWKEASMSIAEIIPAVRALSRSEKFQLAQLLLQDLAGEELPAMFKEGQVYPIFTPEHAPGVAAQLAQLIKTEERTGGVGWSRGP
jgi:hypothetical protein